jgi:acyl carrier protein
VRAVMELAREDELDVDRGFFDLGMDSLMTVAVRARLEDRLGIKLPSTLAIDYPSVTALAGDLEARIVGNGDTAINAIKHTTTHTLKRDPIALSGVEGLNDQEVSEALVAELQALQLEERG